MSKQLQYGKEILYGLAAVVCLPHFGVLFLSLGTSIGFWIPFMFDVYPSETTNTIAFFYNDILVFSLLDAQYQIDLIYDDSIQYSVLFWYCLAHPALAIIGLFRMK